MKVKVVVARYSENIDWIKQFPPSNFVVYNKGPDNLSGIATDHPGVEILTLPNVGREGHTYFMHIYKNYDQLDDYTVFLQGYPFDHSPDILKHLDAMLFGQAFENPLQFMYLTPSPLIKCNIEGCRYHPGLPMRAVYKYLFEKSPVKNMPFYFGSGAQFVVSREQIRKHPKEFYFKIIQLLNKSVCPIEGYVMERFHGLVFAG